MQAHEIFFILLFLVAIVGWCKNAYKLFQSKSLFLLRLAGVFLPILGAILGWI